MNKVKNALVSIPLAFVLCFGSVTPAYASVLDDVIDTYKSVWGFVLQGGVPGFIWRQATSAGSNTTENTAAAANNTSQLLNLEYYWFLGSDNMVHGEEPGYLMPRNGIIPMMQTMVAQLERLFYFQQGDGGIGYWLPYIGDNVHQSYLINNDIKTFLQQQLKPGSTSFYERVSAIGTRVDNLNNAVTPILQDMQQKLGNNLSMLYMSSQDIYESMEGFRTDFTEFMNKENSGQDYSTVLKDMEGLLKGINDKLGTISGQLSLTNTILAADFFTGFVDGFTNGLAGITDILKNKMPFAMFTVVGVIFAAFAADGSFTPEKFTADVNVGGISFSLGLPSGEVINNVANTVHNFTYAVVPLIYAVFLLFNFKKFVFVGGGE